MFKATPKLLLVPAVAMALILSGCTSDSAADTDGPTAGSHLSDILESGEIKIAVQSEAPPWGVLTASGEYEGFDIDLANALGESLGAEVELVSTTNESRIPLLQTDKVDAVIASFTATNERAQQVEFSLPYVASGTLLVVPTDSDIDSYDDIPGKQVSTTRGSVGESALKSGFPEAEVVLFESVADSIQALKSGKVDALIENNILAGELVAEAPDELRIVDGDVINPSLFSIGVKPGDQRWMNYLNTFLRNYNVSGQNEAAHQKWLSTEMPAFLK